MSVVVSNSSPLIGLSQINQLTLLELLFGQVFIPAAVHAEVFARLQLPAWVQVRQVSTSALLAASAGLDPGETEAIVLAEEMAADWLIIDEELGRRAAKTRGLKVTGVLGVLLLAKDRGHLTEVKSALDALCANGFFVSQPLYETVLQLAHESPDQ